MLKHFFFLVPVALLSGCGSAVGNLEAYNPVPLQRAQHMPDRSELKNDQTKIVLFRTDDKSVHAAGHAELARTLYAEIAGQLTQNGTVEILGETSADKHAMESKTLSSARYAVAAEIAAADVASRFMKEEIRENKKDQRHVIPAHTLYTASVSGLITIHAIPSMQTVKIIAFSGSKSRKEQKALSNPRQPSDEYLLNAAGHDAIHAVRIDLKNFFAPKGFILSKRSNGSAAIFKVSLGKEHGLRRGDAVNIYSLKTTYSPTGEEGMEEVIIARGKVSENLTADRAWVILEEENPADPVRLGDYMKAEEAKGTLDYLNDLDRGLPWQGSQRL